MRIDLSGDEVLRAYSCIDFASKDVSENSSWIRLTGTGRHRVWTATDGVRLLSHRGEADQHQFSVLLSPGQMAYLYTAAANDNNSFISVDEEGWTVVGSPVGNMRLETNSGPHPADGFDPSNVEVGASGDFRLRDLLMFIDTQRIAARNRSEDDGSAFIGLSEGHLSVELHSDNASNSLSNLAGRGVVGDVLLQVNLNLLGPLLAQFRDTEDVHVVFPKFVRDPIVIQSDETVACLMPLKTAGVLAREHVEEVIEQQYGHLALQRDDDGDYWLRRHGQLIFGRLREDSTPIALEVFGVLLRDVELNAELLKEINQINVSSPFVKITHEDSNVFVSDELVAESLDSVELVNSVSKIAKALEDYSQTLSVVYGGVSDSDPAELRWNRYRDTIVQAELSPERLFDLNGPDGIRDWPFPGNVFVISGWNPQGVHVDGEFVNSRIAADVMHLGGKFVLGAGVSSDGDHREPSLVVWGLQRSQVLELALKASQDAIFEISSAEISLVSTYGKATETFTRLSSIGDHGMPGYL